MTSNTISVDPRIISPLVCNQGDELSRFPRDTLHRTAITLSLYAELIGNHNGESDPLGSEDHRFALSIQLSGMAALLEALADGLVLRKSALNPGEIPVSLDDDEHEKLKIIACRRGVSVAEVANKILSDWLGNFRPDKPPAAH